MAWILLLLTVLSYYSGVSSQSPWSQPASESASVGQTAKISCTTNSEGNTISWHQQKSGQAPRYVHYPGGSRGDGIQDRFTASVSGSTAYLTITNIQPEDEADYYCLKWNSSPSQYVFGGGTQLTVLSQAKSPPKILLFPPSSEEMDTKNEATLVCLVSNFYPGAIQAAWMADQIGVTDRVETTRPSKQSDNRYMASSYLTLSSTDWKRRETYTCQVTHEGVNYTASVKRSECS